MSDRNPQQDSRSSPSGALGNMKSRVSETLQPGDTKSTIHTLPMDERETILSLDNEEHRYNGGDGEAARAKKQAEEKEEEEGQGQAPTSLGEMVGSVAEKVAKAFGK